MRKLLYIFILAVAASTFSGCHKEKRTGVSMNISGTDYYSLEVIVGTPAEPVTDIDKWRPDVVFWLNTPNTYFALDPKSYTIVVKNLNTNKIISIPVTVRANELTTVNGDL